MNNIVHSTVGKVALQLPREDFMLETALSASGQVNLL